MGFVWAGLFASALSGLPLEDLVADRVLRPLGMSSTGYLPAVGLSSIAATEYQPGRGMVHGEVHDETAHALGGVSGNAGLFGTAPDLLRFAEALRTGRGLSPLTRSWLCETQPDTATPDYTPTLGLRSGEPWAAASPSRTVGHAGFTGTAFFTEPEAERSLVLLTNRVHPARTQETMPGLRAAIVAAALGEG